MKRIATIFKQRLLPYVGKVVRPVQSVETRRLIALILMAWGIGFQFNQLFGNAVLFNMDPDQTAHVIGAILLACGLGLAYTFNGRRATWRGRAVAIIGLGVMLTLAVLVISARWIGSLTYLLVGYGLLGEALVVDEDGHC